MSETFKKLIHALWNAIYGNIARLPESAGIQRAMLSAGFRPTGGKGEERCAVTGKVRYFVR